MVSTLGLLILTASASAALQEVDLAWLDPAVRFEPAYVARTSTRLPTASPRHDGSQGGDDNEPIDNVLANSLAQWTDLERADIMLRKVP